MMKRWLPLVVGMLVGWSSTTTRADDWPQWRGPRRDGVWRESGVVKKFASAELPRRWTAAIGAGYAGSSIAGGRVVVTDRLTDPEQVERVHCFDETTGRKLWSYQYPCAYTIGYSAGPRANVTIVGDRAFALGAMGHLNCLDMNDGRVVWQHDLNSTYQIRMPIWGVAAAPLVDEDLVIVQIGGRPGACLVAFDVATGKERWRALDDDASYAAPLLHEQAGVRTLVALTGQHIVALNPRTGAKLWSFPFPPARMVIGVSTPVIERDRLFVTTFYDGSLLLKLATDRPAAEKIWRRQGPDEKQTEALQSIMSTPVFIGDYVYGVDSYGELRCLDARTGERIWENTTATPRARWSNIHFVRHEDPTRGNPAEPNNEVWLFNERGQLLITRLTPTGYDELSRTQLLAPTTDQLRQRGGVCWSHPSFANRAVFARNDKELVCCSLAE